MDIILLHGMGRSPLSMIFLRHRLARLGHRPRLFGYSPTFESLEQVTERLMRLIERKMQQDSYALLGHSLGTVIIRNAIPELSNQPNACFFLAPPVVACKGAKITSSLLPYKIVNGEMGQLLAQDDFMAQLSMPENTKIYAGTRGPRLPWLPLGERPNDCVLAVDEAIGPYSHIATTVPSTHTFIMNSDLVVDDIARTLDSLT